MKYLACLLLTGCSITPFVEHDSHLTQHTSGNESTAFQSNMVGIAARLGKPTGVFLELTESLDLDSGWQIVGRDASGLVLTRGYGETIGNRERFSARIGYTFKIR